MTRLDGADLSHYQASIDWPALRGATWWCATKATQGTTSVDPTFVEHWAQMRAQGFTHRMVYHWLDPIAAPVTQAQHFLKVVGGLRSGEGVMLDAEQGGITVAGCLAWCEAVEAVTRRPVAIYTGAYVAGGTIWQNTDLHTSTYGKRPFHLAAYTTETKALALPGVKAYPWDAWQYSSNGPVPGVDGRCDMNRIDNVHTFDVACGITTTPAPTPPQPEDDDMKIATNAELRKMSYGDAAPGTAIFVVGEFKRNIGGEEYSALYANATPVALSNVALNSIPDYVAPTTGAVFPVTMRGNLNLHDETFAGTVG